MGSSREVESERSWKGIHSSITAQRTSNPIRKIIDQLAAKPNPDLSLISLSIGDPTVFGNLPPPTSAISALKSCVHGGKSNGYAHSTGFKDSRAAVANVHSSETVKFSADDVIIASGCSGALELCIQVVANEGDNILLPCPGFSLYQGIECRFYNLKAEAGWEVDLAHMESLVDSRTRAVLINNPSNPCGSVFSRAHMEDIVALCARLKLPIISDEIYAHMTFEGVPFCPMATVAAKQVPVLITSGLAKRYMLPGWRVGWVVIHDPMGAFEGPTGIRQGLMDLSTLILGANTVAQAAVPAILETTGENYYESTRRLLQQNAMLCFSRAKEIPGLEPVRPQGAMYMMVRVEVDRLRDVVDDVEFARKLLAEKSVFVLPGSCFGLRDFFRIVVCPPQDKLDDAFDRIRDFCLDHSLPSSDLGKVKKRRLSTQA